MKPKTKKLLASMLLIVAMLCSQQTTAQTLVLHLSNGTTVDVELYTQPCLEFRNDSILITSPVIDMKYNKDEVLSFTYKGSILNINAPESNADVTRDGDRLIFHNIRQSDKVAVYKPNGIRIPVHLARSGNDVTILLSSIPSGVYLLSVNGITSKFTKQ